MSVTKLSSLNSAASHTSKGSSETGAISKKFKLSNSSNFRLKTFTKNFFQIREFREIYPETRFSLNSFADMTLKEKHHSLTGSPSPSTPQKNINENGLKQGQGRGNPPSYSISHLRAVQRQGRCSSDWAISACNIAQDWLNGRVEVSIQNVIDCDKKSNGCVKGSPIHAVELLLKQGYVNASEDPYVGRMKPCKKGNKSEIPALKGKKMFQFFPKNDKFDTLVEDWFKYRLSSLNK